MHKKWKNSIDTCHVGKMAEKRLCRRTEKGLCRRLGTSSKEEEKKRCAIQGNLRGQGRRDRRDLREEQGKSRRISGGYPEKIRGISVKKRSEQKKNTRTGRYASELMLSSAPSGTRTLDTLIKSQVLYQLS